MFKASGNLLTAILCTFGLILTAVLYVFVSTPRPSSPATDIRGCLTTELYRVRLCAKDKSYVKIHNISPFVRAAIITSEDTTFYSHSGFDWYELKNSVEKNLNSGAYLRGGSTITQQLAKNVYLSNAKSILRKIREALITVQLESLLTKDQILEKYLNVIEFAPKTYGIYNASYYYFNKHPSQLSVAESAWLAFVLPNPPKYSVSFKKKTLTKFASSQVRKIITRMGQLKHINDEAVADGLHQASSLFGYADNRDDDPNSTAPGSSGRDGAEPETLEPGLTQPSPGQPAEEDNNLNLGFPTEESGG